MKVKVIIAALLLAGAGMSANAQSTDDTGSSRASLVPPIRRTARVSAN